MTSTTMAARPIVEATAGGSGIVRIDRGRLWRLTHADNVTADIRSVGEVAGDGYEDIYEAGGADAGDDNCCGAERRVVFDLIEN
jgi:hypothetical protein